MQGYVNEARGSMDRERQGHGGVDPKGGVDDTGWVYNREGVNDTGCQRQGGSTP